MAQAGPAPGPERLPAASPCPRLLYQKVETLFDLLRVTRLAFAAVGCLSRPRDWASGALPRTRSNDLTMELGKR